MFLCKILHLDSYSHTEDNLAFVRRHSRLTFPFPRRQKDAIAMRPQPTPSNHLSTCGLALAITLGFAAVCLPAQAQTLTVLYSFTGGADGAGPTGVVRDPTGNLFGTTPYRGDLNCGDQAGCGTAFKLDATGTLTVLHTFTGGADGASPVGTLMRDAAGNLFGTTYDGGNINCYLGTMGCGTVYKLDASGNKTMLYPFPGSIDGALPNGALVEDAKGNLYGTTAWGGIANCNECGTVFKLRATGGTETILHRFTGRGDGNLVYAGVIRDAAGNLYGTSFYGGAYNLGAVFKVDSTGKESVLHSFNSGDGETPADPLVADGAYLYGITRGGGSYSIGTVFKVDKFGNETVLHSFGAATDGKQPQGSLIHDGAGNLYGTTFSGGAFDCGTVFKMDTTGKETILHSFDCGADGLGPNAGVVRDAAGNLYGTTQSGGAFGWGTIFKIAP
jgi:uncharacterized repeat protein (TIGR03803 family)